jgi:hypothetical protein
MSGKDIVVLNVGGKKFETTWNTLCKYKSKLSQAVENELKGQVHETWSLSPDFHLFVYKCIYTSCFKFFILHIAYVISLKVH